jgi:hypothetical protein
VVFLSSYSFFFVHYTHTPLFLTLVASQPDFVGWILIKISFFLRIPHSTR